MYIYMCVLCMHAYVWMCGFREWPMGNLCVCKCGANNMVHKFDDVRYNWTVPVPFCWFHIYMGSYSTRMVKSWSSNGTCLLDMLMIISLISLYIYIHVYIPIHMYKDIYTHIYICVWNANCARATVFIFESRGVFLWKCQSLGDR